MTVPNRSVGVSYLQDLREMGECMSYMRIQAALDYNLTMEDAYDIVDETLASVEVYEIGTPFLRDHRGLKCVRAMRANYPGITLYVDTKIEDIGLKETMGLDTGLVADPYDAAASAFEAGGDIVTIMANSSNRAIEQTVLAARRYGGEVLADLMDVEDVVGRARELDELGVDYVSANKLYVGQDPELTKGPYQPLIDLIAITPVVRRGRTSIQGGVTLENIGEIAKARPSLICIGRGIYAAEDRRAAAAAFKAILDEEELSW